MNLGFGIPIKNLVGLKNRFLDRVDFRVFGDKIGQENDVDSRIGEKKRIDKYTLNAKGKSTTN